MEIEGKIVDTVSNISYNCHNCHSINGYQNFQNNCVQITAEYFSIGFVLCHFFLKITFFATEGLC